jgi:hypothetical protein
MFVQVALLNGITMGGGAGISIPGTFRVATEKTVCSIETSYIYIYIYIYILLLINCHWWIVDYKQSGDLGFGNVIMCLNLW